MTDHPPNENGNDTNRPSQDVMLVYEIRADEPHSHAVASDTNISTTDLEPLYEVVDPEHLDGLFEGDLFPESSVMFHYNGCRVTVTPNMIHVYRDG